jgi:predicted aspartyl protease
MKKATVSGAFRLPPARGEFVGEVRIDVDLQNYDDWSAARSGYLAEELVRHKTIPMLVDTDAANLFLPRELVDELGLSALGSTSVEYADGRREQLDVAGVARLSVAGRTAEVRCIVGPVGVEALLGQVPLKILDLLVDCGSQRLVPRPDSPDRPFSKLKRAR